MNPRAGETRRLRHPLLWVSSSYFAMGTVYITVATATNILFVNLGFSNEKAIAYSSLVGLVYSFKPLWAPFLELYRTPKFYVALMQYLLGLLFIGLSLALQRPAFLAPALGLLFLAAFAGATLDIGCDGVYVTTLDAKTQAAYAGFQGMCWNIGPILASGLLVGLVGLLAGEHSGGRPSVQEYGSAWQTIFLGLGLLMLGLALWHTLVLPPGSQVQGRPGTWRQGIRAFGTVISTFFQKKDVALLLGVAFFFRLGLGLLDRIVPLFLLDAKEHGGLGLGNTELGLLNGILGNGAFILGSVLGGVLIARRGLQRTLLPFCFILNGSNLAILYLGYIRPGSLWEVGAVFLLLKLGWGLGAVAHMIYMMQQIAPGPYRTAHYAFATGLGLGLGMTLTALASAPLQAWLGYQTFFLLVIPAAIPSIWLAARAPFHEPGVAA